jgi:hypothetical protein
MPIAFLAVLQAYDGQKREASLLHKVAHIPNLGKRRNTRCKALGGGERERAARASARGCVGGGQRMPEIRAPAQGSTYPFTFHLGQLQ